MYAAPGVGLAAPQVAEELRLFAFDYGYQGLANHTYIGMEGPWDVHRIIGTGAIESMNSAAKRLISSAGAIRRRC